MHTFHCITAALALAALTAGAGCATVLPTPEVAREVPKLELPPPPPVPNEGRVSLDVVAGRAEVREEVSTTVGRSAIAGYRGSYGGMETKPICTTPCVVNLSYGSHRLAFVPVEPFSQKYQTSTMEVVIGPQPTAARVALERYETLHRGRSAGQITLVTLGGIGTLLGTICLPIGAALSADDGGFASDTPAGRTARVGAGFLGVGGAMLAAGILWAVFDHVDVRQPASSIQWVPSDGVIFRY